MCVLALDTLPLLLSKLFMRLSGCVLNLWTFTVSFLALGVYNLPLALASNEHLTIALDGFPVSIGTSDLLTWEETDSDFQVDPQTQAQLNSFAEIRQETG